MVFHFLCLSLNLFLSLCLSLSHSLFASLYLTLCLSLSHFICLVQFSWTLSQVWATKTGQCFGEHPILSARYSVCVNTCTVYPLVLSIHLISPSLFLSSSYSLSLHLLLSLCHSLSLHVALSISPPLCLLPFSFISLLFPLSPSLSPTPSLSLLPCHSISLYLPAFNSLSLLPSFSPSHLSLSLPTSFSQESVLY